MCGGGGYVPPKPAKLEPPPPAPAPPEETADVPELQENIGVSESKQRRFKSQGTRSLRIPLGGTTEASGLNIPV